MKTVSPLGLILGLSFLGGCSFWSSTHAFASAAPSEVEIESVLRIPDPVRANAEITRAHYGLSQGLREVLGPDAGANFHTWATWGSLKARSSIQGRDVPWAKEGAAIFRSEALSAQLARVTREISKGNRWVLGDIGRVSARFIRWFEDEREPDTQLIESFLDTVNEPLLRDAFRNYWLAKHESNLDRKHERMLMANLQAILHEHRLLQPVIESAMPMGFRRIATARYLQFRAGYEILDVGDDVPMLREILFPRSLESIELPELRRFLAEWDHSNRAAGSRAENWARIGDRMNYICSLFRTRHLESSLFDFPNGFDGF